MTESEKHEASMAINALTQAVEDLKAAVSDPARSQYVWENRRFLYEAREDLRKMIFLMELDLELMGAA